MSTDVPPFVTIVSGLPRSGTSMMMQMLHAGGMPLVTDHIRKADEDNRRGYYEFEPVKRTAGDPSWLCEAPGKAVKVISLLLHGLPAEYGYRVVFMRRDIEEVLASQQAMLTRRGKEGAALSSEQLMRVFTKQLDTVDRWLSRQSNFDVLYVHQHEVIADPSGQAQRVCDFLGGKLNVAAMAKQVEPELYRQRRR